jgi:hypothetical protein
MVCILVTASASKGRILESLGPMAFLARHHGMQPDKRKPRQIMVEGNLLPPPRLLVALLAGTAQLALVRVILAMTGDARHR